MTPTASATPPTNAYAPAAPPPEKPEDTSNPANFEEPACLDNALRLETYIRDAEKAGDGELADFFRRAQTESRKGAEQGKQLLRARLGG